MNNFDAIGQRPVFVTASLSDIKIRAVRNVFSRYRVDLVSVDAKSGVNAQPVDGETYAGALNRIADARRICNKRQNHWVIAIESGIFGQQTNSQQTWADRAVVIVESPGGWQYRADSLPAILPTPFVDAARAKGFDKTTVGSVMAETSAVASANDPHTSLPPFYPRQKYLEESLMIIADLLAAKNEIRPL